MDHPATLEAAMRGGINMFLGAGFSLYARDSKRRNLPVGPTLAQELVTHFGRKELAGLPLDRLSDILRRQNETEFIGYLRHRFNVADFDRRYDAIPTLNISSIITTNIDNLVNKIYNKSTLKHINDLVLAGPAIRSTTAVDFIPLHGHVDHPDNRFDFGTVELASAFARDPDRFHFLTERLQAKPTFYWGFAMNDAGPLLALEPKMHGQRPLKEKWIALREGDEAQIAYFTAMGFHIVIGDTADLLDYIGNLKWIRIKASPTTILENFHSDRVPDPTETVARPIANFYLGNAPTWFDIFSNRILQTRYFHSIQNRIHEGKNIFITGIPQSGKSTLLMQLAANIQTNVGKLFVGYLSPEKANQLLNAATPGEEILIFIDEAGSSMQGISVLNKSPHIRFVAADRNMNIDVALHVLLKSASYEVVDVSDLSTIDAGEIYRSIPESVRRPNFRKVKVAQGRSPSIFEIVSENTTGLSLVAKFRVILPELERRDVEVHDLFLLSCYLHACRTPMSFEVALGFMKLGTDITLVYKRIEALGALLSELGSPGEFYVDDTQDYFVARSNVVAMAAIDACTMTPFGRVFDKFHRQVSHFRIPQYDSFKRSGYDAEYALKAYPNWDDGSEFYDRSYSIEENFYMLQ
jgi:hypothetical protein